MHSAGGVRVSGGLANQEDGRGAAYARQRGPLLLREKWSLVRLVTKRAWLARYAVLQPATGRTPPRLQLFAGDSREEASEKLTEELHLVPPLRLHCVPSEAAPSHAHAHAAPRFSFALIAADGIPIELAAPSDDERQRCGSQPPHTPCTARTVP